MTVTAASKGPKALYLRQHTRETVGGHFLHWQEQEQQSKQEQTRDWSS